MKWDVTHRANPTLWRATIIGADSPVDDELAQGEPNQPLARPTESSESRPNGDGGAVDHVRHDIGLARAPQRRRCDGRGRPRWAALTRSADRP